MNSDNVELTQAVIGAAMTVLNKLKPGLDEKLYECALVIELHKQGLRCEQQKAYPVHYDSQLIGTLVPDLIVDEKLIVDPKVVTDFNDSHVPNDRLSQHYGPAHRTSPELQVRQARHQTRLAFLARQLNRKVSPSPIPSSAVQSESSGP